MCDPYNIEFFEEQNKLAEQFLGDKLNWIKIWEEDIVLNDKIAIHFYPNSQKYIYDLYTKYGVVTTYDNDIDNMIITNDIGSYYATHCSKSYSYTIYCQKK